MLWAWLGACGVGLSLGLLGSGGAILTVPILVYLVGHDEKTAIVESLAIVGVIALVGAVRAGLARKLDLRSAALLAVPGVLGTWLGAWAAGFVSGAVQLAILALLMLTAAALMARSSGKDTSPARSAARAGSDAEPGSPAQVPEAARSAPPDLGGTSVAALQGVGLGFATGLVGVGGGFLIVPVLVLVRRIPMATAVGTSLAIIAFNCASGLLGHLVLDGQHGATQRIAWGTVGVFSVLGVAGSIGGTALGGRIKQATLRRVFAVFLVVMAGYILVRQWHRVMGGVGPARERGVVPRPADETHLEP